VLIGFICVIPVCRQAGAFQWFQRDCEEVRRSNRVSYFLFLVSCFRFNEKSVFIRVFSVIRVPIVSVFQWFQVSGFTGNAVRYFEATSVCAFEISEGKFIKLFRRVLKSLSGFYLVVYGFCDQGCRVCQWLVFYPGLQVWLVV